MISTANDALAAGGETPSEWSMTVLELSTYLCVYRAPQPSRLDDVRVVLGDWFEQPVSSEVASSVVARMVRQQWLAPEGDRLRATYAGREVARPLMNGLVRMLDQGTRLIDVALMMSVLRLTRDELAGGDFGD